MPKIYKEQNVFDASMDRIKYVFSEFENVLVAFSGGKDSGMLLNLCYKYAKENNMLNKLAMYHLDYEAQYQATTEYVDDTFKEFEGIKKYWLCVPIAAQCAVSMTQNHWIPWDPDKKDIWCRDIPEYDYVITEKKIQCKFNKGMWDYDLQSNFCKWFSESFGKTAVMIGIRTDESLNRFRAINNTETIRKYKDKVYINQVNENTFNSYPIYDWNVEDIWIANAKCGFKYNPLYDLMYKAGLTINQMRVASPFNDCAIESLKMYKAIEPNTWGKLIGRVNGVNFSGIYGGTTAMGWKSIKLPPGHTWKSYMYFLLDTLPPEIRENYLKKLKTSIDFWKKKGGALDDCVIEELKNAGMKYELSDVKSNYSDKQVVKFEDYPDDAEIKSFKIVPSYKRMCVCIMKNDHMCKYMGFSQTKIEKEKRDKTIEKYKCIARGGRK